MADVQPAGSQSGSAGAALSCPPRVCFLLCACTAGVCCLDSGKKFHGLISETMKPNPRIACLVCLESCLLLEAISLCSGGEKYV